MWRDALVLLEDGTLAESDALKKKKKRKARMHLRENITLPYLPNIYFVSRIRFETSVEILARSLSNFYCQ